MPCKRAKRSFAHMEEHKTDKNTMPTTTHGDRKPDENSPWGHFDFLREFWELKSRDGIFDYVEPLFQVSSLETLRMNLRFDEDAKGFLRLKLSRDDVNAVQHVYERPENSTTNKPPRVSRALDMIHSSSVSSIDEALKYYCHLHKLQRMIYGIADKEVKRDFIMFQQCFFCAFDPETSST